MYIQLAGCQWHVSANATPRSSQLANWMQAKAFGETRSPISFPLLRRAAKVVLKLIQVKQHSPLSSICYRALFCSGFGGPRSDFANEVRDTIRDVLEELEKSNLADCFPSCKK